MAEPIEIHGIDEFSEVISIRNDAINETILSNVTNLDEEKEIEPHV